MTAPLFDITQLNNLWTAVSPLLATVLSSAAPFSDALIKAALTAYGAHPPSTGTHALFDGDTAEDTFVTRLHRAIASQCAADVAAFATTPLLVNLAAASSTAGPTLRQAYVLGSVLLASMMLGIARKADLPTTSGSFFARKEGRYKQDELKIWSSYLAGFGAAGLATTSALTSLGAEGEPAVVYAALLLGLGGQAWTAVQDGTALVDSLHSVIESIRDGGTEDYQSHHPWCADGYSE